MFVKNQKSMSLTRSLLAGFFLLGTAVTHAQCDDPVACNYDENTTGTEGCTYFDTQLFSLEEYGFMGLYDASCETQHSGWNDLELPLVQDSSGTGPLMFVIPAEIEAILLANNYDAMVADFETVNMAVCGSTMNYSGINGFYVFEWDGYGFFNSIYGGYWAPESSYTWGCPNPWACNFDPCSHPWSDECEFLPSGYIEGDTVLTVDEETLLTYVGEEGNSVEWWSDCTGADLFSNFASITPYAADTCEVCAIESDPNGCSTLPVCLTLTIEDAVEGILEEGVAWSISPNPATDRLTVGWLGARQVLEVRNNQGALVETWTVTLGQHQFDLSSLAPGVYFVGPQGGKSKRVVVSR